MTKGKVLVISQPKTISYQDLEDRQLQAGEVRLKTLYSGISAGTELTAYRGTNVYIQKEWDPVRRLFLPSISPSMPYPLVGWGYEEVGEVIELGPNVKLLKAGDVIGGTWGHKSWHIAQEDWAHDRLVPAGLEPLMGIFTHMGPIALNGVLDANIHLGETVAVFGLGVVGQIVARLAKLSGARVIGMDFNQQRLDLAKIHGAVDIAINPKETKPAEAIKDLTRGLGADVSIEASGSSAALNEAIRSVAYAARVVVLGFIQGEAKQIFLGEEFHHNRIQLVCSQIGGVSNDLSTRWNRLRLIRTIYDLQASSKLDLKPLITHQFPFEEAEQAFELLDTHPEDALQVVLQF